MSGGRLPGRDDLRRDGRGAVGRHVARGRRGSIVDVAETGRLVVPDGAEVVDLAGRFVIPGLVDAHQHLATPPDRAKARGGLRQHGLRRRHRDPGHGRRPPAGRRPRSCLPGRGDPRPRHPLRRADGRARLLRRSAYLAGLPGGDAGPGALDAGDHRRDRPRHRHRARAGHPRQCDQGVRRPLRRPGRSDRDRGPPPGDPRLGAPVGVPRAAPRRGGGRRRRGVARVAAALADPGRRGRDVQDEGADRPRERGPGRPPASPARSAAMVERGTILDATASMWESHEVLGGADAEAVARAQGQRRPGGAS